MATHSSVLACRILWTEEPGGLQSMGSQIVGHDWSILPRMHTSVMPSPPSRSEPYLSPPKVSFYPLFIDYYYFMVRTLKIYPPSRFLAHNTALLTIGIVLYSRSLKLFILHNWHFASSNHRLSFPTPHSFWQPPLYSLALRVYFRLHV